MRAFSDLGIKGLELNINSIGCPSCRKVFNEALQKYLKANYDNLCETCKVRFEKNPMRILDCKNKNCKEIVKGAPSILDYLCDECEEHFDKLKSYLTAMDIDYKIDPLIVRGLDYYTKTVFEIIQKDITVCGGGRYDGLIEEIGGPSLPAFGFAIGIERLIMTLEEEGIELPRENPIDLFVASMDETSKIQSLKLVNELRKKGLKCEINHMKRNVKAQMKYSNKIEASYTIVLGETEIQTKTAKLKRMSDGEQFEINLDNLKEIFEKLV
jgi:histidyl-tRNA synthetase